MYVCRPNASNISTRARTDKLAHGLGFASDASPDISVQAEMHGNVDEDSDLLSKLLI